MENWERADSVRIAVLILIVWASIVFAQWAGGDAEKDDTHHTPAGVDFATNSMPIETVAPILDRRDERMNYIVRRVAKQAMDIDCLRQAVISKDIEAQLWKCTIKNMDRDTPADKCNVGFTWCEWENQ